MPKIFWIFVFVGFGLPTLQAQKIKQFTHEPKAWFTELQKLLKDDKKAGAEVLLQEFGMVWESGDFTPQMQEDIFKTSNNFIKKRTLDYEIWKHYLSVLSHLIGQEETENVKNWIDYFQNYSRRNTARAIRDQLGVYYMVFYDSKMFDDGSLSWQFTGSYELKFSEGEPSFSFEETDLFAQYKGDSTFIEGTRGVYIPATFHWQGQGGEIFWDRTGLTPDSARAAFSTYELFANKTNFEADSVTLYTIVYPLEPLQGRLEERLSPRNDPNSATFPRFYSYRQDVSIEGIAENVNFLGGISVMGRKIYGSGGNRGDAAFVFYYEGNPKIIARGERFRLRDNLFTSERIALTVYLDEDSIYHPKVYMRLVPEQNTVTFLRQSEGLSLAKFTNTYHNVNMAFEALRWKMDEPRMIISNMNTGTPTPVVIESNYYYRMERFMALQGYDLKNPLYNIRRIIGSYGGTTFDMETLAREMRLDVRGARIFAMKLAVEGYGSFDLLKDEMTFGDKVYDYIDYYEEKKDYDVIAFVSQIEGAPNGYLSLLDNDLILNGVRSISLSDSQEVRLFPFEQKIVMHKDLNFDFNGAVVAGRFAFWGNEFSFIYDQFRLNMVDIDSMRFKVERFYGKEDITGTRPLVDVQNVLQDLTGELLIDHPNNKSGKVMLPEYPIFRSAKESYVYFDNPKIFSGVYPRKSFYIELAPFEIDSLDNAKTESIEFEGVFVSAGIFPDIDEPIKVQRDYSLGFVRQTPESGYPAYGGKGRFFNTISLSNKGLKGDGQIEYLTATAQSGEWFFFPDSTNGLANDFEILAQTKGTEYPHVTNVETNIHWEPYNDKMFARNTTKPFQMYDEVGMTATGELTYSPSSLRGNARIAYLDAENESEDFLFRNRAFESQKMSFRVRKYTGSPWAFSLKNARGEVNFDLDRGQFTLNNPAEYFNFEIQQYISYMDFAEWRISPKTIEVSRKGELPSSRMVSTHREQDSLQFVARSGKFSLITDELEVFRANEIPVADATIYPDTGYVVIDPGAKMRRLENSKVTANRTNKYHEFNESSIQIHGRKKYDGNGYYEYIDEDKVGWPLFFQEIKVTREGMTQAFAEISEEDHFFLSSFFAYKGRAFLEAPRKHLLFDGSTLIQHACENILTDWFSFRSIIDPDKIVIDLPVPREDGRSRIKNGIYISNDSTSGYSAFLTPENPQAAYDILTANGKLYYDHALNSYIITSAKRIEDPEGKGNYLALNNRDCFTEGDGVLSFGDRLGQVKIEGVGRAEHQMEDDLILLDFQLALDFFFNDDITKKIAQEIMSRSGLAGVDLNRPAYKAVINQLLDGKTRTRFVEDLEFYGAPEKLPKELQNTFTFSDIQMEWNPNVNAFLSVGQLGIGSIGKEPIFRKVDGILEIARKRRGDEIRLYIELDNKTFYFFEYRRNMMSFYSSDDELMAIIRDTDPNKRKQSGEKGQQPYTYTISTRGKMNRFLNRMDDIDEE